MNLKGFCVTGSLIKISLDKMDRIRATVKEKHMSNLTKMRCGSLRYLSRYSTATPPMTEVHQYQRMNDIISSVEESWSWSSPNWIILAW